MLQIPSISQTKTPVNFASVVLLIDTSLRCGVETEYDVSSPVTVRRWYIEGSGQLCEKCFFELYPMPSTSDREGCARPTVQAREKQNNKE